MSERPTLFLDTWTLDRPALHKAVLDADVQPILSIWTVVESMARSAPPPEIIERGHRIDQLSPWWLRQGSEIIAIEVAKELRLGSPPDPIVRETSKLLYGHASVAGVLSRPELYGELVRSFIPYKLVKNPDSHRKLAAVYASLRKIDGKPKTARAKTNKEIYLRGGRKHAERCLIKHGYLKIAAAATKLVENLDVGRCQTLHAHFLLQEAMFADPNTHPQPGDTADMNMVPAAISYADYAIIDRRFIGLVRNVQSRLGRCATVLPVKGAVSTIRALGDSIR